MGRTKIGIEEGSTSSPSKYWRLVVSMYRVMTYFDLKYFGRYITPQTSSNMFRSISTSFSLRNFGIHLCWDWCSCSCSSCQPNQGRPPPNVIVSEMVNHQPPRLWGWIWASYHGCYMDYIKLLVHHKLPWWLCFWICCQCDAKIPKSRPGTQPWRQKEDPRCDSARGGTICGYGDADVMHIWFTHEKCNSSTSTLKIRTLWWFH